MTVSSFLIESLQASGTGVFFGLPGVHALGLWNALEKAGARYIGFRHEQAAAHAADGYGRITGNPGVVLLSTGPGALNAVSALAEALVSSSPVVAITSAIPSSLTGKQKGYLHDSKDLQPAFASVTRFSARANSADEIPELIAAALEASLGSRPGPSLLEIPTDLLDAGLAAAAQGFSRTRLQPDPQQIEEAAFLLGIAARPVIWAGGGILRSGASAELTELAEATGAPVITTFMGKTAIAQDHPLSIGTFVRQPEAIQLLADADLLLAVGTRFSAMATGNWKMTLPPQLIHIDIDPTEIGCNYPARLGIVADAKTALGSLTRALRDKNKGNDPPARQEEVARIRKSVLERARQTGPREMEFLDAIRAVLAPATPVVADMNVASYWAWPFFETTVPNTFHTPYGYASLGWAFPAALGITAATNRPAVALCGDGGFQYHLQELATAAQHSLPVITIVFNDQSWGVLKAFELSRYQTDFGTALPSPNFPALAASFGIRSARAEDPPTLAASLKEALHRGGPALIEVPGAWTLPPPSKYYS